MNKIIHPTITQYTFSSNLDGTFTKNYHLWAIKPKWKFLSIHILKDYGAKLPILSTNSTIYLFLIQKRLMHQSTGRELLTILRMSALLGPHSWHNLLNCHLPALLLAHPDHLPISPPHSCSSSLPFILIMSSSQHAGPLFQQDFQFSLVAIESIQFLFTFSSASPDFWIFLNTSMKIWVHLRALSVLQEDPGSIPSTYKEADNSSPRSPSSLFWLP